MRRIIGLTVVFIVLSVGSLLAFNMQSIGNDRVNVLSSQVGEGRLLPGK
jgi:hypothetical protein